jgi:tetratricopeptide (TPR) repeat protein
VDELFACIDLTLKKASEPSVRELAILPSDSTTDTYATVAQRAFGRGDFVEAEELFGAALDEATAAGAKPTVLASYTNKLADAFLNEGKAGDAEQYYKRAAELREQALGPDFAETAESLNGLGLALSLQGR